MLDDSKTARDVIVAALTARHEELSGEASPRDFDGAGQILRALDAAGFAIVVKDVGDELTVEERRALREIPTHTDEGVRLAEWERELFARQLAKEQGRDPRMIDCTTVHLALRNGQHACDARYPGLFSTTRREAVNCPDCAKAELGAAQERRGV